MLGQRGGFRGCTVWFTGILAINVVFATVILSFCLVSLDNMAERIKLFIIFTARAMLALQALY